MAQHMRDVIVSTSTSSDVVDGHTVTVVSHVMFTGGRVDHYVDGLFICSVPVGRT